MTKGVRILFLFLTIVVICLCLAFFYRDKIESFFTDSLHKEAYQLKYEKEVDVASKEFGVPKELIYAVIKIESNFNPEAKSHAGAIGLMQLIPDTYSWVALRLGEKENPDMISDPLTNIRYGTYYLSFLSERLESDEAIYASYNAGYTRVKSWLSDSRYSSDGIHLDSIPYEETSNYVKKVSKAREEYKKTLLKDDNSSR